MPAADQLSFRILGTIEVWRDGGRLEVEGRKQQALLALLVLNVGRPLSPERLIDELWGERPPAAARRNLHVHLSRLRATLGDGILVRRDAGYELGVDRADVDLQHFEALADEGHRLLAAGRHGEASQRLREALALWRGAPLCGLEDEPFVGEAARWLDELRLAALEDRVDADLARGDGRGLVAELEALVREQPFRERLHGQLMLALYRHGRQADALALYRRTRADFAEQLGIEPGPALQELERSILVHDPALGQVRRQRSRAGSTRPRLLAVTGAVVLAAALAAAVLELSGGRRSAGLAAAAPNSVAAINPTTNRVVGDTPVGNTPTKVAVGAGSVWVLNADEQTVTRIDPGNGSVLRVIPADTSASDIAVSSGAVWVASTHQTLARIDPEAPLTPRKLDLPGVRSPVLYSGLATRVAAIDGAVWATTTAGVWRIEPTPRRRFAVIEQGCCGPIAIGLGSIWVVSQFGLDRLDARSGRRQAHIKLPFPGSSLAVGAGGVWVSDQLTDRVWLIDPKTNALDISIPVGQNPSAVAIGVGSVWVASADGTVSRIDPNTDRVTSTIVVGGTPGGIAVGANAVWVAVD